MLEKGKAQLFAELSQEVLRIQGFTSLANPALDLGLDLMKDSFPNRSFPLGAVHEFLSEKPEEAAATTGFVAGLLTELMGSSGTALWISSSRTLFPPALRSFALQPDRFIFIDLQKEKEVMWAMDEALKCNALSAVVGELKDVSFINSRRLQLAVEQSKVTGFILRHNSQQPGTTACVSRWKITQLPSESIDDLPGIGFPKWRVELLRMRNGKPGAWNIQNINGKFAIQNSLETPQESSNQYPASVFRSSKAV